MRLVIFFTCLHQICHTVARQCIAMHCICSSTSSSDWSILPDKLNRIHALIFFDFRSSLASFRFLSLSVFGVIAFSFRVGLLTERLELDDDECTGVEGDTVLQFGVERERLMALRKYSCFPSSSSSMNWFGVLPVASFPLLVFF